MTDKEKAALNGVTADDIAADAADRRWAARRSARCSCAGERNPLPIELRLPRADPLQPRRTWLALHVKGRDGQLVPLAELGAWEQARGRPDDLPQEPAAAWCTSSPRRPAAPPADAVVDVQADQAARPTAAVAAERVGQRLAAPMQPAAPADGRTFLRQRQRHRLGRARRASASTSPARASGRSRWTSSATWAWPSRAALVGDLHPAGRTRPARSSFRVVVMLAIPLTIIGIMPGFWLLNHARRQARSAATPTRSSSPPPP